MMSEQLECLFLGHIYPKISCADFVPSTYFCIRCGQHFRIVVENTNIPGISLATFKEVIDEEN